MGEAGLKLWHNTMLLEECNKVSPRLERAHRPGSGEGVGHQPGCRQKSTEQGRGELTLAGGQAFAQDTKEGRKSIRRTKAAGTKGLCATEVLSPKCQKQTSGFKK